MAFDDEGFPSPDFAAWIATTRAQFKDWFELVYDLNRDAMKILSVIEPSVAKNQELVASLLYRRALQSFQGAVLMAERGMIADALTLVRSCAETAIAIGAVGNDQKFADALIEDHHRHRMTYANALLKDPDSLPFLTREQISDFEQVVADLKKQYPPAGPKSIRWEQAAIKAKMTDLYITIYRMTSSDAVHTTVNALDRHVETDDRGKIKRLTFRPETRDLEHTLSFAANALLHAMHDRYWEITFDPDGEEPTIEVTLSQLIGITGWDNRKIVGQGQSPSQIKMREKDPLKRFEKCHFALNVSNSSFSNSCFYRCTFEDSTWVNVKFSKCTFEGCHFARVFFDRCQFLNSCKFSKITASAELFRVEGTSLSSSSFLGALTTNVDYLPLNTTKEYQFYRLRGTKEKLAKLIYESTKSEANIDFYFEAFKELILAMLDAKVEYHRFKPLTSRPTKKSPWVFYALSFPYRVERGIVKLSGSFSDWGRSIFRPMLFFLIVVIFFTMLYYALAFGFESSSLPEQLSRSAIAALNVTLVAGCTAFFNSTQPLLLQACEGVNLLLGLFWYSLIVPTITRKILR